MKSAATRSPLGESALEKVRNEFCEGVIVLPEGSFDGLSDRVYTGRKHWSLELIQDITRELAITVIGQRKNDSLIVKNGNILSAQRKGIENCMLRVERDTPYDVSPISSSTVYAICRVCAFGSVPYTGSQKPRLLCISSGGIDWSDEDDAGGIPALLKAHRNHLIDDAYIVQADHHRGRKFIYSVADKKIVSSDADWAEWEIDV